MVSVDIENGLVIRSEQGEITSSLITNFLDIHGFEKESELEYRLSGDIDAGQIELFVRFLRDFFPNLQLSQEVQTQIDSRTTFRENIENLRERALEIKSQIFSDQSRNIETTVPRLREDRRLYWYQAISVEHACAIGNSANFSVPGSGKTWMAYSTFFKLKDEQQVVDKILIIGPKVAYRAWEREYFNMTGQRPSICNITGNRSIRDQLFQNQLIIDNTEIFFINYAMLAREQRRVEALLDQHRFLVIADESHHFKNQDTETAGAMGSIADSCERKMILTGTMMPKDVHDLWSQFNFLLSRERVLPDFDTFKMRYPKDNSSSIGEISNVLNPFFSRVNKPTLELPPQTFNDPTVVEMFDIQRRIYEQVRGHVRNITEQYREDQTALRDWKRRALVFLIEAATDPSLLPTDNEFTHSITNTADFRLDELLENYEGIEAENPPRKLTTAMNLANSTLNAGGKVVIWCSFIKTIQKLSAMFDAQDIQNRTVYGAVPADEIDDPNDNRSLRIDEFSEHDDINVLIANPATLAESVSLHDVCHHAIYVDRTYNGGHWMQSLERIHRVGMDANTVTTYDVIQASPNLEQGLRSIDHVIAESLERKTRNMTAFLNSAELGVMRFRDDNNQDDYRNIIGNENELDRDYDDAMNDGNSS